MAGAVRIRPGIAVGAAPRAAPAAVAGRIRIAAGVAVGEPGAPAAPAMARTVGIGAAVGIGHAGPAVARTIGIGAGVGVGLEGLRFPTEYGERGAADDRTARDAAEEGAAAKLTRNFHDKSPKKRRWPRPDRFINQRRGPDQP